MGVSPKLWDLMLSPAEKTRNESNYKVSSCCLLENCLVGMWGNPNVTGVGSVVTMSIVQEK